MTTSPPLANDLLEGVEPIAAEIGKNKRKTYYLLETRQLPAFKLGGKWHMRRSALAEHIKRLEAAATR